MLKKNKRLWAGLLSLALIVTQFSATAAAREDDEVLTVGMSNEVDSGQIQHDENEDTPSITVGESDEKDSLVKTITSWKFVDDENLNEGVLALPGVSLEHQADFDTVVSMLPTQITADIEGEEEPVTLGIPGWACPEFVQDEKLNYPVSGEFTFTAMLPDGYACEPLPSVKVLLGGGSLYANEYGGLTITGGAVTQETDGQIKLSNGTYEISGTWNGTLDAVNWDNEKAVITVPDSVTANVTLKKVSIDVSSGSGACAFAVAVGGTANITLSDTNTLTSGNYRAGLEVPEKATVTISGSGELNANGGDSGAGIGGGRKGAGGTIKISGGKVTAQGGDNGAGIGGGIGGAGGTIRINGGFVNANGGSFGAGIGGGDLGAGGSIEISGGTVTATGGSGKNFTTEGGGGSGIGGGNSSDAGNIMISGGTVTATGGSGYSSCRGGSGIGGGDNGGNITISGGTITATGGSGRDIGGIGGIGIGGSGGIVKISGEHTNVIATGADNGFDVGGGSGGSLSVTDRATLEMKNKGTNVDTPEYKNCTIKDKDGKEVQYGSSGRPIASPTLTLEVAPAGSVTLPNTVTLTATLSGTLDNSSKTIEFTVNGITTTSVATTASSGKAAYTPTNLTSGTYSFGASFKGDGDNNPASAAEITGYTVNIGTQGALEINGLSSTYTYGDNPFTLSTTGGSGNGTVSYTSSNSAVASVSGNTVTIRKAGTFTITATKAADSQYGAKTVTSGTVTVREATPNLTLTATGGATTNHPITLTATVSRIGTGATPAGMVTFREGNAILASGVRLDGAGKATYTVNRPTVGNHTYTVEYSGQSGYYNRNSATCTVTVNSAEQTGFMIESPGAKTYGDGKFTLTTSGGQSTGSVSFSVPDGNGVLTVTDAGEVEIIGVGSVTVTATKAGNSDYNQATATLDINVAPRDISNVMVSVKGNHVYTGKQIQPDFEVSDGTIAITKDDYTHQYDTNVDAGKDAGGIILTGQRNYTGSKTVKFDIEPRPLTDAVITLESGPFTYTGKAIQPAVTSVGVNGIPVPAESYEVGYADNIKAGTATVTITAKADSNFSGTASTTFIIESVKNDSSGSTIVSGGSSPSRDNDTSSDKETTKSQTVPEPKRSYKAKGNKINQTVSRSDLRKLANSGKSLTLTSDKSSMVFNPAALKVILAAVPTSVTNITFNATPADLSAFPDAAKLIGSHPVYDFAISYKSNNKAVPVKVNLPAGSVSIGVNYTPASAEITGNLFMVYVDDQGTVTWLNKSSYANGKVSAEVSHFSTYGVGYKTPETVFTDIGNHSAKKDIEWAVARDLFPDTEKALFSPDSPITKGMLVTALGRLAGVNPDSYQSRSFTDVKVDASYAPYAEWAVQKNIIKLTDKNLFSPDEPITRENLAVIMANYVKQSGYSLSSPAAAVTFTDSDKISTWAKKEVTTMQRAGIMKGKDGSRFEPQSNSTRGEVSAILRRFVEGII